MNLEQANRALHEFTDALHADSQRDSDLAVSKAFCPQQYTSALFWGELRKCVFKVLHSLIQEKLLFRTRSRIYAFSKHWTGFLVVAAGTAKSRAVHIHGKIVSDTEYPRAKIVPRVALKALADEPEKRVLDDVFRLIRTHTQAAKIRAQGRSQMIVEIDDALAGPDIAGLFGNQDSKIAGNRPIPFRAGTSQRSAKFLKDVSSHLPSKEKIAYFRSVQPI
jgi:hypothetical protein